MSDDQGPEQGRGINVGLGSHDPEAVPRLSLITGVGSTVTLGSTERPAGSQYCLTSVTLGLGLCHVPA